MESIKTFALWTVLKLNPPHCRRELVNAYTYKPTAKEKDSLVIKRLRYVGDR